MKELKGNDESEEEWDRLQWGSLHGLAEDKRNGMKQRTMGKPICMWSSLFMNNCYVSIQLVVPQIVQACTIL